MHDEIQAAPARADLLEHGFELAVDAQVQRQQQGGVDAARQRLDVDARLVVQVGHGQFGAQRAEGARATPGYRVLVGDAGDEPAPALQGGGGVHACLCRTSASVCWAMISSSLVRTT
ncbi:Uncharacterised protein [Bordetella pertussis]|nr:Uncharacterised protein [Bordetella pertussis]CFU08334.1 Uncharacterised protein [Bordetella pertussis]CFW00591.1 Uncharacterised protein [Bordetella pertussis]